MVTVIFPAAGQGKRMQAAQNKIFLKLAGVPIFVHTLRRFSACSFIDNLIIVAAPAEVSEMKRRLAQLEWLKPYQVVAGGSERQYSIANALQALPQEADIVLVHDMARPLILQKSIQSLVQAVKQSGAAIVAVPEKNTIKVIDTKHEVVATPDRASLWAVQTPQGFTREIILRAYQAAAADGILGTDDASLVERIGVAVKVVEGDYGNIKVTTPEDIILAEALLKVQKEEI